MRILIHAFVGKLGIGLLVLVLFFFYHPGILQAQFIKRPSISGGLQAALPMKEFKTFASFGLGPQVQAESAISKRFTVVGTTGWTHFFGKDYGAGKTKGTNAIPFLTGARYYPFKKLFVGLVAGCNILIAGRSSEIGFNYMPQIGYTAKRLQWVFGYSDTRHDWDVYQNASLACLYRF